MTLFGKQIVLPCGNVRLMRTNLISQYIYKVSWFWYSGKYYAVAKLDVLRATQSQLFAQFFVTLLNFHAAFIKVVSWVPL